MHIIALKNKKVKTNLKNKGENMDNETGTNLVFLYDKIKELQIIQNFIRENTTVNENGKLEAGLLFGSELINLIKYIDTDFYNELQHRTNK